MGPDEMHPWVHREMAEDIAKPLPIIFERKASGVLGCIKKSGQHIRGGDPVPLFSPDEATSGVLCRVLGSPIQERQGTTRASPEENISLNEGKTERAGTI